MSFRAGTARHMKAVMCVLCLLHALSPSVVLAMEQTDKCHCFRDRVFNPTKRFQADDYLLTTVGNSLTASHFSISKRRIVTMKMQGGTSNNDLLIGLYLGGIADSQVKRLLAAKEESSWQEAVADDARLNTRQNDAIVSLLKKGETAEKIAGLIMQAMLQKRFDVSDETLLSLNQAGLSPRETALVLTLAEHVGIPPGKIAAQNRTNGLSWSEIAHNFGLAPAEVGKLILAVPTNPLNR
jgi:hypothetical protein